MEWLLEHPQVFVIIAGVLAYMVRRRRPTADDEKPGQAASQQPARGAFERANRSSQEDERARQIREEMIRRREQRTGVPVPRQATVVPRPTPMAPLAPPPPPMVVPSRPIEAPSPVFRDPMAEMMKEIARRFQQEESPEPARAQVQADADVQEKLSLLQARITVLEREKAAAEERAKVYGTGTANPVVSPGELTAGAIIDDLVSNVSLRRAIILNEVLGRPVALR